MTPEDVPGGPLCVDTDVFSFLYGRRGRHTEFRSLVEGHLLVVSFATVGELRAGAMRAGWAEARRQQLDRVLRENYLADCD